MCHGTDVTTCSQVEPENLLRFGLEQLKAELRETGWEKPYVLITHMPDAIGTVAVAEERAIFPIMWRSTADSAENLWYFIHEVIEYRLVTEMCDLPRWFWEGMAQIVAFLVVDVLDPSSATAIKQRYLDQGMASLEDYLAWEGLWCPVGSAKQPLSAEEAIREVLNIVNQVHFTVREREKYARALEFFHSRVASLSEVRALWDKVQELNIRTTEQLLACLEV